ncbi:mediator of RNA polymerase II transcription subunit 10-like [Rhopilema esculentum]|uniref:mediator of RNA polymerase II transcription subunit 10-like n=1 Tax=Rhopilema esculentum TaxID=499914 RepID=UPI0031CFF6CD|eukprot:gene1240-15617_t
MDNTATEGTENRFETLQQNIEQFIETTRQIGIMVSDFQPGSQDTLNDKINNMITDMQEIDRCKHLVQDVEVPLEIFQYVDQGKNPELYTEECFKRTVNKNEEVKSKVDAYKNFRMTLTEELTKEFPEMMVRYHQFKKQQYTAPERK